MIQSVVLQQIGFGGKTGTSWHKLWETALGNLIITALGFLPGTSLPRVLVHGLLTAGDAE